MCLLCVYSPCVCDLVKLELKIEILRRGKEMQEKEEKQEIEATIEPEEEGRKEGGLLGGHGAAQ